MARPLALDGLRALCVCANGNSRSVALAYLLKTDYGIESIAIGLMTTSPSTQAMLFAWADSIIVTDATLSPLIPAEYAGKVKVYDVGADRFFKGFSHELIGLFKAHLRANPFTVRRE